MLQINKSLTVLATTLLDTQILAKYWITYQNNFYTVLTCDVINCFKSMNKILLIKYFVNLVEYLKTCFLLIVSIFGYVVLINCLFWLNIKQTKMLKIIISKNWIDCFLLCL